MTVSIVKFDADLITGQWTVPHVKFKWAKFSMFNGLYCLWHYDYSDANFVEDLEGYYAIYPGEAHGIHRPERYIATHIPNTKRFIGVCITHATYHEIHLLVAFLLDNTDIRKDVRLERAAGVLML